MMNVQLKLNKSFQQLSGRCILTPPVSNYKSKFSDGLRDSSQFTHNNLQKWFSGAFNLAAAVIYSPGRNEEILKQHSCISCPSHSRHQSDTVAARRCGGERKKRKTGSWWKLIDWNGWCSWRDKAKRRECSSWLPFDWAWCRRFLQLRSSATNVTDIKL